MHIMLRLFLFAAFTFIGIVAFWSLNQIVYEVGYWVGSL